MGCRQNIYSINLVYLQNEIGLECLLRSLGNRRLASDRRTAYGDEPTERVGQYVLLQIESVHFVQIGSGNIEWNGWTIIGLACQLFIERALLKVSHNGMPCEIAKLM